MGEQPGFVPPTDGPGDRADASAGVDLQPPLSRRERRLLEERAATNELPPPVPRIAPITSYTWDRETDREPNPLTAPVAVADPVDRYRDIPSRWGSASVWVLAFMPWITTLCLFAALLLEAWGIAEWQRWGAVALPYLHSRWRRRSGM